METSSADSPLVEEARALVVEAATADALVIDRGAEAALRIERTRTLADSLGKELRERGLVVPVGDKMHVTADGWAYLGGILGVTAEVLSVTPIELGERDRGWEAEAVLRAPDGSIVGRGQGICLRSEARWSRADTYALRGMAATRAIARAWRQTFGFVAAAAGFSATPAEEMPS